MYKHILIATDGSEVGDKAVEQALSLAKSTDALVTAVNVTALGTAIGVAGGHDALKRIKKYELAAAIAANRILVRVREAAAKAGVKCEVHRIPDRIPAQGIIDAANSSGCDLIVMGSRGRRGLNQLLLGSQALEVMTHSKVPVMIFR